jgi:hypothetical protein
MFRSMNVQIENNVKAVIYPPLAFIDHMNHEGEVINNMAKMNGSHFSFGFIVLSDL